MGIEVFLFGVCLGSFANVLIFRLPRGVSTVWPRSHCPACFSLIRWYDNIPLLSFFLLRGACRHCRSNISFRYPLVEGLMGGLFLFVFFMEGSLSPRFFMGCFLVFWATVLSWIDWDFQIIPDEINLALACGGWVAAYGNSLLGPEGWGRWGGALKGGAMGWVVLWGVAWVGRKVFKKDALGGGDIKYLSALGLWVGGRGVLDILLLSSCLGTIVALPLLLGKKIQRGSYLPFGPFLALASGLVWWGFRPIQWLWTP